MGNNTFMSSLELPDMAATYAIQYGGISPAAVPTPHMIHSGRHLRTIIHVERGMLPVTEVPGGHSKEGGFTRYLTIT